MVKKILILAFLSIACRGVDEELCKEIQNLIGDNSYFTNQNFINRLFKNPKEFYLDNGDMDYYSVLKVLRDNGLFNLTFKKPSELKIHFNANANPIFLTKTINDVFSSIGYSYFAITYARYVQHKTCLTFSLVTEHIVDPVLMIAELKKRGLFTLKVNRSGEYEWNYELDPRDQVIRDSTPLFQKQRLELKNISGEYWFSTKCAGVLQISKKNNRIGWFPRIVLFDKNLQILEIITQESFAKNVEVNITDKTAFVMVTDLNSPARLKHGITIQFTPF